MHRRKLGRTGLEVSEIGYGAWGIGATMWLGADDDESLKALNRAVDLGVTLIDTALAYGDGHSEELVGRVVRERDEQIAVCTKIPPENGRWPAPGGVDPDDAFPAAHVRECTERSLRHLGLDTIDLQQFHVWSDEWVGRGSWLEGIEGLKAEGKIRAFGVSINDHQPANALKLIESGAVDAVHPLPPGGVAAIPGMRTVRNVERNAAVGDGRGLPEEQVAALKRHRWGRNFYR